MPPFSLSFLSVFSPIIMASLVPVKKNSRHALDQDAVRDPEEDIVHRPNLPDRGTQDAAERRR